MKFSTGTTLLMNIDLQKGLGWRILKVCQKNEYALKHGHNKPYDPENAQAKRLKQIL